MARLGVFYATLGAYLDHYAEVDIWSEAHPFEKKDVIKAADGHYRAIMDDPALGPDLRDLIDRDFTKFKRIAKSIEEALGSEYLTDKKLRAEVIQFANYLNAEARRYIEQAGGE